MLCSTGRSRSSKGSCCVSSRGSKGLCSVDTSRRSSGGILVWPWSTYGIPYAKMYGIPQIFKVKMPRNSAKFRGIPCIAQKFRISSEVKKLLPWTPCWDNDQLIGNENTIHKCFSSSLNLKTLIPPNGGVYGSQFLLIKLHKGHKCYKNENIIYSSSFLCCFIIYFQNWW